MHSPFPEPLVLMMRRRRCTYFLAAKSPLKALLVVGFCVQFPVLKWFLIHCFTYTVQQGLKASPLTLLGKNKDLDFIKGTTVPSWKDKKMSSKLLEVNMQGLLATNTCCVWRNEFKNYTSIKGLYE